MNPGYYKLFKVVQIKRYEIKRSFLFISMKQALNI